MLVAAHPALAAALCVVRRDTLKPPPKLDLVEWADTYRYLSPEAASQPGRWSTANVEVARGPMLAVSDPAVHQVTVMCCTQLAKTELLLNIIGYFVHQDPAPMLLLQPTVEIAEAFSKDRVDPMFRDSPALRGRLGDKRSRDGGNTILHKQFPGGHLTMVGANSPGNLAMRPVRVVLCDEVDKYPASAGDEGDPIKLASERSATFWNWLLVTVCSPTITGRSRIEAEYDLSDKRVYHVPCPHCDEAHEMLWEHVVWQDGEPEGAAYHCPGCGAAWTEPERLRAIKRGTWHATAPFKGHAGFTVSKLASPWEPLSKLAAKWEACGGNPQKIKTFYNTQLARTWKEVGEAPGWQRLYDRRGPHPRGHVPADVAFLTAGIDVQQDRLELEVVGWAPGKRSYSIDYRVIPGDTATPGPWDELAAVLTVETWTHASGAQLPIRLAAVDSGFRASFVYDFCRRLGASHVVPVKGRDNQPIVVAAPKPVELKKNGRAVWRSVKLYTIGVDLVKAETYAWLRLERGEDGIIPPGFMQWPGDYEERHFKELTSEVVTVKLVRGFQREAWEKTPGVRNEPLDCRVYARAAAAIVGLDRWGDRQWRRALDALGAVLPAAPSPPAADPLPTDDPTPPPAQAPAAPAKRRRESSFWG